MEPGSAAEGFVTDMNDLRRVEDALRESELKFRTLFDKAADAVFLHNEQGRFLDVNQRACESLGYSREELLAKSVFDVDPDAARREVIKFFWEDKNAGEYLLLESTHMRKDGSRFPVEVRLGAVDLPQGRLIVAVVRDISERKRAEEQLQRERDFSTHIINSMPGIFYVLDEQRLVKWNPKWEKITGYGPEELAKMHGPDFFAGDDQQLIAAKMEEVFRTGQSDVEAELVMKDGRRVPYYFTGARCFFDGKPHLVGLGIDITARKAIEAERENLIAKLEAQNAELERFTYTVSHDLKSPLITIKGFVGMLRDDIDRENAKAIDLDLSRIAGAADKMSMLLNDLLSLSRIGRLVSPSESVSLAELAKEAVELNIGRIKAGGARIEIAPNLPVLYGDRGRLLEVMQNLIDNALKYMGEQQRPLVEIGSYRDGGRTVCYVRDNGMGIEREYCEKIFGLFEKLDPKAEGTGIGLALARRIIELHGGKIWVESEGEGRGSTFFFTLPEEE